MNANRARVFPILLAAGLGLSTSAVALDVKPGLWEFTATYTMKGVPPVDLAKLPPEARAEIERDFAAEAGKPETSTEQQCVTQEDIEAVNLFEREEQEAGEECVREVKSASSTRFSGTEKCRTEGGTRESVIDFEARTPQQLRGTIKINAVSPNGNTRVDVTMVGKWLAASCGDLE